ncbi:hypothetical protein F5Y16DRAFT_401914 [Xylariaceae sp. FL0255]|nr:hypothetical protein F5Y16DRAFT_401914 [Xylariaceae sp. FL0255]
MFGICSDKLKEYIQPMSGIPVRLPIAEAADAAVNKRSDLALSIINARHARRLTLAPQPRTITVNPPNKIPTFGAKAMKSDPVKLRPALQAERSRPRVIGWSLIVLLAAALAMGSNIRNTIDDTIALRVNMRPAFGYASAVLE